MANFYTQEQQNQIRSWLLELRRIVATADFAANRDRARQLVALLDQRPTHPACLIAYEYGRVRRIWRRLETQSQKDYD